MWATFAARYPEVTTGDVAPGADHAFASRPPGCSPAGSTTTAPTKARFPLTLKLLPTAATAADSGSHV
jgi:hypothetical protein